MAEIKIENMDELAYGKYILTRATKLREKPDKNSHAITILPAGMIVEVAGFEGDYAKVVNGYCFKKNLKEG